MTKPTIRIFPDAGELARAATVEFVQSAETAVRERGIFHVALSGGSTPKGMFGRLASDQELSVRIPWNRTHVWWSDERHVPPGDPDSNFKLANDALLSRVAIPSENVHRVQAEEPDAVRIAANYESEIRAAFHSASPQIPQFDLVLLGMGPDGHTASLFPGTRALYAGEQLVAANWVGKFFTWRITFTAPLINNARTVMVLVAGKDKALALEGVLEGPLEPAQLPAQLIQPIHGTSLWLLDESAAGHLTRK